MQDRNRLVPRLRTLVLALGATCVCIPVNVQASLFREASDAELAGMRGRFVAGDHQVAYFGVQMMTRWQTRDGASVESGVALNVNADYRPTITIVNNETAGTGGGTTTGGSERIVAGNALNTVQGVGQSIQIGGDGNAIRNDIVLNVGPSVGQGTTVATGSLDTAGNQVIHNANGSVTTVVLNSGGLRLGVAFPGQGTVSQQLRTGGGVFQSAAIGGDLNRIASSITINASTASLNPLNGHAFQSALNSLQGLRQVGMY